MSAISPWYIHQFNYAVTIDSFLFPDTFCFLSLFILFLLFFHFLPGAVFLFFFFIIIQNSLFMLIYFIISNENNEKKNKRLGESVREWNVSFHLVNEIVAHLIFTWKTFLFFFYFSGRRDLFVVAKMKCSFVVSPIICIRLFLFLYYLCEN